MSKGAFISNLEADKNLSSELKEIIQEIYKDIFLENGEISVQDIDDFLEENDFDPEYFTAIFEFFESQDIKIQDEDAEDEDEDYDDEHEGDLDE